MRVITIIARRSHSTPNSALKWNFERTIRPCHHFSFTFNSALPCQQQQHANECDCGVFRVCVESYLCSVHSQLMRIFARIINGDMECVTLLSMLSWHIKCRNKCFGLRSIKVAIPFCTRHLNEIFEFDNFCWLHKSAFRHRRVYRPERALPYSLTCIFNCCRLPIRTQSTMGQPHSTWKIDIREIPTIQKGHSNGIDVVVIVSAKEADEKKNDTKI